jgi:cytochrome c553
MAALMEQMYVENDQLKKRILDNESVGKFPAYFEKIHTAKMTDESENDDFFKDNAKLFIDAQKLIYTDSLNTKKHFNSMVNACITCHEVKCGGPIAKIKKLRITN